MIDDFRRWCESALTHPYMPVVFIAKAWSRVLGLRTALTGITMIFLIASPCQSPVTWGSRPLAFPMAD